MKTHIELIQPGEKLAPSLGGTGYLPPGRPASRLDLMRDALARAQDSAAFIDLVVWKVARHSVAWHRGGWRAHRILKVGQKRIKATVVGSQQHWYFVAVEARATAIHLGTVDL